MRKLPLYIFTENLNFFFRLNKVLKEKKIQFKILNFGNKISDSHAIILTTNKELDRIIRTNNKCIILDYSEEEKFDQYLLKVVSSYRVGYKEKYTSLTFSIDPGNRIGLMVFLDDFYVDSYCCFKSIDLIQILDSYISYFQGKNANICLYFKFGIGAMKITHNLVKIIFNIYKNLKTLKVFLIDEFKSSKIKVTEKKERKFSKDEISALILSLREGIEVNQNNYETLFKRITTKSLKIERWKDFKVEKYNEFNLSLEEIANRVLNGDLSLEDSTKIIKKSSPYLSKSKY